MTVADHIGSDILNDGYFKKLFKVCVERSYNYMLKINLDNLYTRKEYQDLLRFADLLSISSISEARNFAYKIITYLNPFFTNDPHYSIVSKDIMGEDNAGENWATLLEYGTQDRTMIALQNMGL